MDAESKGLHRAIEARITAEYTQAEKEISKKLDAFLAQYESRDKKWQEWLADGSKTEKQYKRWKKSQIIAGKRWADMRDSIAYELLHADTIARNIVTGMAPDVFGLGLDYGAYQVEHAARLDISYTLYDRDAVAYILKEDPQLLHAPGKKVSREIAEGRAVRWNKQVVQSSALQSVLQGETMSAVATRLATEVGERNRKAAIRNARTMMTGLMTGGQERSFMRAASMGIKNTKQWLAALDGRTRHSHRMIDGECAPLGKKFSNGCMKPGDPDGPAAEVYNCRCDLGVQIEGFEDDASDLSWRRHDKLGDMSYEEWRKGHGKSKPITSQEEWQEKIKAQERAEYGEE